MSNISIKVRKGASNINIARYERIRITQEFASICVPQLKLTIAIDLLGVFRGDFMGDHHIGNS
jgi:hypothetical protein